MYANGRLSFLDFSEVESWTYFDWNDPDNESLYIEPYNNSINNAANDVSEMSLTEYDIKLITEDCINKLKLIRKEDGITSSYEVIGVITEVLESDGFNLVLKEYIRHE